MMTYLAYYNSIGTNINERWIIEDVFKNYWQLLQGKQCSLPNLPDRPEEDQVGDQKLELIENWDSLIFIRIIK